MKGNKDKERNTLYITHRGELLIWLIIFLVIISLFTFSYFKKISSLNDYNIFMPDVDGLIVGSPVRMMGIEVGHVTKIEPTNGEVYVRFIIADKNMQLPQGTIATVEFSGMAGSKSLELYLPDKNTYVEKNTPILTVEPPKRLHDAMGLLNEMFEKLNSIIYASSSFAENLKFINIQTGSDEEIKNFIKYTDDIVEESNKKAENLEQKLNSYQRRKHGIK